MYKITLENKRGETLELLQRNGFSVVDIQGLESPDATINTSEIALIDGGKFNSSKVNMRTINIAFYLEFDAPKKRIEVYKVVRSKQYIKLYYEGDYRNVYIEGYVESCPIDFVGMKQMVTVSILCPSPYFKEAQMMVNDFSNIVNAFHFPFAIVEETPIAISHIDMNSNVVIDNKGDVDTGVVIELYARGNVENPKIFDYLTGEYVGLNVKMETGDLITIDTRKGEKSVTLLRDGVTTNIFNTLMKGSKWFELLTTGGVYTAEAELGQTNLVVTIKHYNLYVGV